jgi:hypothetical protein
MIDIFGDLDKLKIESTKESPVNPHIEQVYQELYDIIGIKPVRHGFGFIQRGNPSTICFDEAMEAILNYVKDRDSFSVGDVVTFVSTDDWIEPGSKGIVTGYSTDENYSTVKVKFHTGNASDRTIECSSYNLVKYKSKLGIV